MSYQERQNMRRVDEMILGADPAKLRELQDLDEATQLDGGSFYDACLESRMSPVPHPRAKPGE